jgi:prepilin signal peptidase PulO-like enzyme (type II secretory pathway)
MQLPVLLIALLAALLGFIVGVLVNLLADYLPARRYHILARADPFVSRNTIPPIPNFLPRRADGRLYPLPLWSGVVAAILREPVFSTSRRVRRIVTEIGMAMAFAAITSLYANAPSLPFLLFYAAIFALVAIIDIEWRWIMWEVILPGAAAVILETALGVRLDWDTMLRGGLYGFLAMFGLYVLGLVFAQVMRILTGRAVGRTVLGLGDVRMGTLSGMIVGWGALGPVLLIMILTGALAALLFIVSRRFQKRRYRRFSAIAYGPYIVIGTAAMLYVPWIAGDLLVWILNR